MCTDWRHWVSPWCIGVSRALHRMQAPGPTDADPLCAKLRTLIRSGAIAESSSSCRTACAFRSPRANAYSGENFPLPAKPSIKMVVPVCSLAWRSRVFRRWFERESNVVLSSRKLMCKVESFWRMGQTTVSDDSNAWPVVPCHTSRLMPRFRSQERSLTCGSHAVHNIVIQCKYGEFVDIALQSRGITRFHHLAEVLAMVVDWQLRIGRFVLCQFPAKPGRVAAKCSEV